MKLYGQLISLMVAVAVLLQGWDQGMVAVFAALTLSSFIVIALLTYEPALIRHLAVASGSVGVLLCAVYVALLAA